MIIRCKHCQAAVWVHTDQASSTTVACRHCGQEYRLEGRGRLSAADRRLGEEARKLAADAGIDVPGAYSVLLGIMTMQEVRELGQIGSTAPRTTPAPSPGDDRAGRYDAAFRSAVEAGHLTARLALERGKRDTYAAQLSSRHRLPIELAYAVADNRTSLLEALRSRAPATESVRVRVRSGAVRQTVMGVTLAMLVLASGAALYGGLLRPRETRGGAAGPEGLAEVRSDTNGRVVQVFGPDPRSVLNTYGDVGVPGRRLKPLHLVPSALPGTRSRIGLLRDPADPANLVAITIREDRERGRWVAGDGQSPLIATPASQAAQEAARRR